ncbi:TolC family protein [Xanthocytophaga agilis]|uniref:TolC family protein n=1 Tax=Xanthocytophaga agilis TaxID=3048010 RepID=A0AAE3R401_9BACT|nr:TolC family protein [Xanthocytophaga agilis]MDJ1503456.1 TolC family protein [Xanthocytophaga agilis]
MNHPTSILLEIQNTFHPSVQSQEKESSQPSKTRYFTRLTLLTLLLVGATISGQGQQVNLQQVLNESKQNYPLLKAKQAEVTSAQRRVKSANTEYLPNVIIQDQYTYATNNSVTGSYYPNEGTAISPSGGIRPDNIYQGVFGSFTTALLEWKIINFGKVAANVQAARNEMARSQLEYENELFQQQIRVIDSYLLLLISQKLVMVQRSNLERARIFREVVASGVSSGMRPGVDSSLANAEYTKAQLLLLESQRNEKAQRLRLSELTGNLQDSLAVDSMSFYTKLPIIPTGASSIQNNPLLRLYQAQTSVAEARSIAVRRSFRPSISFLAAGWARGSGVSNKDDSYRTDFASGVNYQVYNYMIGISTRWNLTSIFKVHNDYQSEKAQLQRYQELYNDQSLKLNRQFRESEMQFALTLDQARLAPVQLNAARRAMNQARARYESGLTDLPTVMQSLLTLNRAEVDQYVAISNAWRSLLLQAAATGDLSLFLNQLN